MSRGFLVFGAAWLVTEFRVYCFQRREALARGALPAAGFVEMDATLFRGQAREVHLAWNPRVLRLRSVAGGVLAWMGNHLKFGHLSL